MPARNFAAVAAELAEAAQKEVADRAEQARALEEARIEIARQSAERERRENEVAALKRHVESLEAALAAERGDGTLAKVVQQEHLKAHRSELKKKTSELEAALEATKRAEERSSSEKRALQDMLATALRNVWAAQAKKAPSSESEDNVASSELKRELADALAEVETLKKEKPMVEKLKAENEELWNDLSYMDEQIQLLSEDSAHLHQKMRNVEERRAARVYGSGVFTARGSRMLSNLNEADGADEAASGRRSAQGVRSESEGVVGDELSSEPPSQIATARTSRMRSSSVLGESEPTVEELKVANIQLENELEEMFNDINFHVTQLELQKAELESCIGTIEKLEEEVARPKNQHVDPQMQATFRIFSQGDTVFDTLHRMWQRVEAADESAANVTDSLDGTDASKDVDRDDDHTLNQAHKKINDLREQKTNEQQLGEERLYYVLNLVTRMSDKIVGYQRRLAESHAEIKQLLEAKFDLEEDLVCRGVSPEVFRRSGLAPDDTPSAERGSEDESLSTHP